MTPCENVCSPLFWLKGTLELFSGLGMMAGPPLGGLLYQVGALFVVWTWDDEGPIKHRAGD